MPHEHLTILTPAVAETTQPSTQPSTQPHQPNSGVSCAGMSSGVTPLISNSLSAFGATPPRRIIATDQGSAVSSLATSTSSKFATETTPHPPYKRNAHAYTQANSSSSQIAYPNFSRPRSDDIDVNSGDESDG